MKTMKMKIDLQHILMDVAKETGMGIPFAIANGCLARIAERAIEIKDEKILDELETLCYVSEK